MLDDSTLQVDGGSGSNGSLSGCDALISGRIAGT
jgi:hypothetical protein